MNDSLSNANNKMIHVICEGHPRIKAFSISIPSFHSNYEINSAIYDYMRANNYISPRDGIVVLRQSLDRYKIKTNSALIHASYTSLSTRELECGLQSLSVSPKETELCQILYNSMQEKYTQICGADKKLPKIGMAISGGGNLVLTYGMAVLIVLKKLGILQLVLHCSGVSGGAWLLFTYLSFTGNLEAAKKHMISVFKDLDSFEKLITAISSTFFDTWVKMLSKYLKKDGQMSELAAIVKEFGTCFPIFAIAGQRQGEKKKGKIDYRLFEVTPFEVIDTRENERESLEKFEKNCHFSKIMAICGEAFTVDIGHGFNYINKSPMGDIIHLMENSVLVSQEKVKFNPDIPGVKDKGVTVSMTDYGALNNFDISSLLLRGDKIIILVTYGSTSGMDHFKTYIKPVYEELSKKYKLRYKIPREFSEGPMKIGIYKAKNDVNDEYCSIVLIRMTKKDWKLPKKFYELKYTPEEFEEIFEFGIKDVEAIQDELKTLIFG